MARVAADVSRYEPAGGIRYRAVGVPETNLTPSGTRIAAEEGRSREARRASDVSVPTGGPDGRDATGNLRRGSSRLLQPFRQPPEAAVMLHPRKRARWHAALLYEAGDDQHVQ